MRIGNKLKVKLKLDSLKDDLKSWDRILFSKHVILSMLIFAGLIVWLEPINSFISSNLLLPNPNDNSTQLTLLVSTILFVVFLSVKVIKYKYELSSTQLVIVTIVSTASWFYLFPGFIDHSWKPIPVFHLPVSYLVLNLIALSLFTIICICRSLKTRYYQSKINESNLVEDVPLTESPELDNLANRLVEQISKDFKSSFSVGIIGPWGNGKSTFFNSMKNRLTASERKFLTLEFSPFKEGQSGNLTSQFLSRLSTLVKPYSGKLSNDILDYYNIVSSTVKNKNFDALLKSLNIYGTENTETLFARIEEALSALPKKIVVFVDDLDRLNGKEIIEVFSLIRSSADFKNVIYLVAYDKEYTRNAIVKQLGSTGFEQFDSKFFSLEVFLPFPDVLDIKTAFKALLDKKFPEKEAISFKEAVNSELCYLKELVLNYREMKKVFNQLFFEYELLKDGKLEINETDLINIILLKLYFPHFFNILFTKTEILLELNTKKHYSLRKSEPKNDDKTIKASLRNMFSGQLADTTLGNATEKVESKLENGLKTLNTETREILLGIMGSLFGIELANNKRLAFIKTFEKYKALSLGEKIRHFKIDSLIEKFSFNDFNELDEIYGQDEIFEYVKNNIESSENEAINLVCILLGLITKKVNHVHYYGEEIGTILWGRKVKGSFTIKIDQSKLGELMDERIFSSNEVSNSAKVELIFRCVNKETQNFQSFFGKDKNYFETKALELYNDQIKKGLNWGFDNVLMWYKRLQYVDTEMKIRDDLKKRLFSKDQIEYFILTLLVFDKESNKYYLNEWAKEIFPDRKALHSGFNVASQNDNPFIIEFLEFLSALALFYPLAGGLFWNFNSLDKNKIKEIGRKDLLECSNDKYKEAIVWFRDIHLGDGLDVGAFNNLKNFAKEGEKRENSGVYVLYSDKENEANFYLNELKNAVISLCSRNYENEVTIEECEKWKIKADEEVIAQLISFQSTDYNNGIQEKPYNIY